MTAIAAAAVFALLVSWAATRAMRAYANARGMLDVPNERSSHSAPTPRGGGAAIVVATLLALVVLHAAGKLVAWRQLVAVAAGGALVALVGFVDDRRSIHPMPRLLAHLAAGAWLVWWVGSGAFPSTQPYLGLGFAGDLVALLYVVWLVNLTNFMDGIDGIASVEAVSVAFGGSVLLIIQSAPLTSWSAAIAFAGACLGFLAWNWPPAKIFMGDVGSGFLGYMLAALSLWAGRASLDVFWGWVILLGVFVVDATWTLLRRLLRGETVFQAHRTHGYQHAADRAGSHRPVTLAVLGINLLWLLPVAILTVIDVLPSAVGVVVAYVPLVAAAIVLGAGTPMRTARNGQG